MFGVFFSKHFESVYIYYECFWCMASDNSLSQTKNAWCIFLCSSWLINGTLSSAGNLVLTIIVKYIYLRGKTAKTGAGRRWVGAGRQGVGAGRRGWELVDKGMGAGRRGVGAGRRGWELGDGGWEKQMFYGEGRVGAGRHWGWRWEMVPPPSPPLIFIFYETTIWLISTIR